MGVVLNAPRAFLRPVLIADLMGRKVDFGHIIMLVACWRLYLSCSVCTFHLYLLLKCRPSIFIDVSFLICICPVVRMQTCMCLYFVEKSMAPE